MKLLVAYGGAGGNQETLTELTAAGLPAVGSLLVFSVVDAWMPPTGERDPSLPAWVTEWGDRSRQRLAEAVTAAQAAAAEAAARVQASLPGWKIDAAASADSPAWAIITKADSWGADLVVVGSHGRTGPIERAVLGSVAQKVLAQAGCSVRIVRAHQGKHDRPLRILVGVDGSTHAEAAVRVATTRIWPAGSQLRLVMGIDQGAMLTMGLPGSPVLQWAQPNDADEIAWAQRMLEAWAERSPSNLTTSCVVRQGDPKNVLIEEARQWEADCIFLGSRGLGALDRFLIGSVSLAVASRAPCSVEIMRTRQRK